MGALNSKDMGSGTRFCFGHGVLLAGCLLATLPVFASFLPIDLGIDPRLEPIPMVLHLAAGICAIGLSITFLTTRDRTLWAVSHPIVLAALFVAAWSVLTAPFADYPWLSLIGVPVFGEAAVRYASLAAFFGAALVLAADRRTFVGLCAILVTVSVLTPIVMFMWGRSFFVSLDLVGYFAIPAALGTWFLTGRCKLYLRLILGMAAVLPAFALSTNHSVIAVLTGIALPAALASGWILHQRPDKSALIRVLAALFVVAAPFFGLLVKWLAPEIIDLPSIHSRHLLDRVLFAALMDNPLILVVGHGWGGINLTMDQFALSAGANMWDGSWDLALRNVSHSHSTYLEALFGAGLPALFGLMMIHAAPVLVVKAERLPLAVFASTSLAALGAVTGEFPASVGAVAMVFAMAGLRPFSEASSSASGMVGKGSSLGRANALSMPALAALLLVAAFWQFHDANTTRIRVADVRALGPQSASACDLHPYSRVYAGTELAQGLIRSYRPVFKRAAAGDQIGLEEIWQIDAYVCSANARLVAGSMSPSLLLATEAFRVDVALGQEASDLPDRYRAALENWPAKLARVVTLVPNRTDVTVGFFLAQVQQGKFYTVGSLAEALLKQDPDDPVALWFLGLARLASGEPANRLDGRQLLARAVEGGVERFFPIAPEILEQLGVRDEPRK